MVQESEFSWRNSDHKTKVMEKKRPGEGRREKGVISAGGQRG